MIKQNWQVFVNSGLVTYMRGRHISRLPYARPMLIAVLLAVGYLLTVQPLLAKIALQQFTPGVFSRVLALDPTVFGFHTVYENNPNVWIDLVTKLKAQSQQAAAAPATVGKWTDLQARIKTSLSGPTGLPTGCLIVNALTDPWWSGTDATAIQPIRCFKGEHLNFLMGFTTIGASVENPGLPRPYLVAIKQVEALRPWWKFWASKYENTWEMYYVSLEPMIPTIYDARALFVKVDQIIPSMQAAFPAMYQKARK